MASFAKAAAAQAATNASTVRPLFPQASAGGDRGGPAKGSLFLINPPEANEHNIAAVRAIEQAEQAQVSTIISPGDWHHFQLPAWSKALPNAKLYCVSQRPIHKQPEIKDRAIVLDYRGDEFDVPELNEDFRMLSFKGCQQPMGGWLGNDARGADRVEMVMFHKHSRTLFVTDHVLVNSSSAKSAQESADAVVLKLSANTGGFSMKDAAEARRSCERVLALGASNVLFSHGNANPLPLLTGGAEVIRQRLRRVYESYWMKEGKL